MLEPSALVAGLAIFTILVSLFPNMLSSRRGALSIGIVLTLVPTLSILLLSTAAVQIVFMSGFAVIGASFLVCALRLPRIVKVVAE